jgi:predicted outer membrane repeat protein
MTSNSAKSYGGAVNGQSFAATTIQNSTMVSNTAGAGGAFQINDGANLTATDCLFLLNRATNTQNMNGIHNGGGVGNIGESYDSAGIWKECLDNPARCPLPNGFRLGTAPTAVVVNCTFSSNSAVSRGGVIRVQGWSNFITINCSFSSNYAADIGGVMVASYGSSITAIDSTMTANSASSGGVLYADLYCIATFQNCSMFSNSARNHGGTVATAGNATVTASHSTMASNVASQVHHMAMMMNGFSDD